MQKIVQPFFREVFWFFCLFFRDLITGLDFWRQVFILAIIIVPFIISVSREVIFGCSFVYKESALCLGGHPLEAIFDIVLSYGRVGILGR